MANTSPHVVRVSGRPEQRRYTRSSTFRLDSDLREAMTRLEERDGMPASVQVRRALQAFLAEKDVLETPKPQPAANRRKHR